MNQFPRVVYVLCCVVLLHLTRVFWFFSGLFWSGVVCCLFDCRWWAIFKICNSKTNRSEWLNPYTFFIQSGKGSVYVCVDIFLFDFSCLTGNRIDIAYKGLIWYSISNSASVNVYVCFSFSFSCSVATLFRRTPTKYQEIHGHKSNQWIWMVKFLNIEIESTTNALISDWCCNENVIFIVMLLFIFFYHVVVHPIQWCVRVRTCVHGSRSPLFLFPIPIIYISIWFSNRFTLLLVCKEIAKRKSNSGRRVTGTWHKNTIEIFKIITTISVVKWKRMLVTMPQ